jgi:hypothetical protein
MPGMLQQQAYKKVLPSMSEQGHDIRLHVDNIEKQ